MSKKKGWWEQLQNGDYPKTQLDYGDVQAVGHKPESAKTFINSELRKTQGDCPKCGALYWVDKSYCPNCGWGNNHLKTYSQPSELSPIDKPAGVQVTKNNHQKRFQTRLNPNKNKSLKEVIIYTDGACIGNPGPGGYGAVLVYGEHRKELFGGYRLTTNNRMEIMAAIAALSALKTRCRVDLYSDSQYVVNAMTKGWVNRWKAKNWMRTREEKAKNPDLWEKVLELCSRHQVTFHWIKGHDGHAENERCDQLAVAAASSESLPPDRGYEASIVRYAPHF